MTPDPGPSYPQPSPMAVHLVSGSPLSPLGPGPDPFGSLEQGPGLLRHHLGYFFMNSRHPDAKKSRNPNFQISKVPVRHLLRFQKSNIPQKFPTCHFSRFQKSNIPQEIPKCHFSRFQKANVPQDIPKCHFSKFQKSNARKCRRPNRAF